MSCFSKETIDHLRLQQGLSERYQRRAQDVTLACKLTHVYRDNRKRLKMYIMSMRELVEAYKRQRNYEKVLKH